MKTQLVSAVILASAAISLGGCATLEQMDRRIPDGKWSEAHVHVAGKFTSTDLRATGTKRDGKWVEGELHFKHANPWVLEATVDLEVAKP